ncbi:MAG: thiamine pyrophosphate-binding protein [Gemmatimonadales bacterium]
MKLSGAEIVGRALEAEGITHAFGIPGTHNLELYDVLSESDRVQPVLVTDEQSAGFMADGFWRVSGRMACVNLVPGAGLTHALSGIAEAYLDGVPMLVLGCGIRRGPEARAYQLHDIDQLAIAAPVTKAAWRAETGAELYPLIRRACAFARQGTPGPVMVEVSVDHYLTRHDIDPARWRAPAEEPVPAANEEEIARTAQLLTAPEARPLLYVGLGAQRACRELVALAERLDAPVATTIQGKGVFPESHPLFLWNGLGATAPPFVRHTADERTVTLAIGCRFGEVGTGSYGFTPPGKLIHVDVNPQVFNRNFPAELTITSDAALFLKSLLRHLDAERRVPSAEPSRSTAQIHFAHDTLRARALATVNRDRVSPARLLDAIHRQFGPETIFTADSGNGMFLAMELLRLEAPGRFLAPVDYSCMGYAIPAAIGAGFAQPGTPVVALAGDGAFLMTGLELLTAASFGVPVAGFVLRDRELAQIAQFQRTAFGRRTASGLPDFHVGSLAEAVGVEWLSLSNDEEVEAVVRDAHATITAGRPLLVDVAIDYRETSWFTRGVVGTNLARMAWPDRLRFVFRALTRKFSRASGSSPRPG